jgi:2-polyprenyl-3-methyl-5-hydroxy-6-metoxy-1,4-benzoquinol methylase
VTSTSSARNLAARRAIRSFESAGISAQAWALARMLNAPLAGLDNDFLALKGRLLSIGCGFGVVERYISFRNPHVEIVGLEIDADRVHAAHATQGAAPKVTVTHTDVTTLAADATYDNALVMDLLHHLAPPDQLRLMSKLSQLIRPGGTVLIKDIATQPAWKHTFNMLHDRLVAGDHAHCLSPTAMASAASDAGLTVVGVQRLSRFSPYPHYLVRASA